MTAAIGISVAIPTFGREQVLIDTIRQLLALEPGADEILILDQTKEHQASIDRQLGSWRDEGRIHWIRLPEPSIPRAMNQGLLAAENEIVLFLDDDIVPDEDLVSAHARAHAENPGGIVAGRVLQPWHDGQPDSPDGEFRFNSLEPREVQEFMGGNFSLRRDDAINIGGFDENFVRVAYRFEAEFAHRRRKSGKLIRYEPEALIHHLKAGSGGTRAHGEHLTTIRPDHAVGAYYYMLTTRGSKAAPEMFKRLFGSVMTRHHARKPWWIPATLVAEVRGLAWASRLYTRGARLIQPADREARPVNA